MATVRVPLKQIQKNPTTGKWTEDYVYDTTSTQKYGPDKKVYVTVEVDSSGRIKGYANDDGTVLVSDLNGSAYYKDGTEVPASTGSGSNRVVYEVQGYGQPETSITTVSKASISYYYTISDGYIYVAATTTGGGQASASRTGYANFRAIGTSVQGTGVGNYVSSRNDNTYPVVAGGAIKNGYWYTFTISDHVDPQTVIVSDDDGILRPGLDTVTISITEQTVSTLKSYGNVQYEYYYSVDNGATWILIETTAETSIQFAIPATDTLGNQIDLIIVGVKFKDNIGYIGDMVMTDNLALTNNMPPIISGVDEDLGELKSYQDDRPTLVYRVWDEDTEEVETTNEDGEVVVKYVPSDIVTVVEYVDDIQTNQYQFKGITETMFSFPDSIWLTLLNGQHSIRIVATDDKGNSTTRTYTFTKAIDEISVMFEEPMESLEAMYLAVEEMVAELPTGSQLWVYVCNDGFDEHPSWQDATVEVRNGTKIYITNAGIWDGKEAEEMKPGYKWGYNVWVRIKRGEAEGPVYLTSVDGHWK